jgi:AraC-like DNA-binding protein/quercetin dioxygenase-like cupin family protein
MNQPSPNSVIPISGGAAASRIYLQLEHNPRVESSDAATTMLSGPGFRIVEGKYKRVLEIASHSREHAHFCYVLEGQYTESSDGTVNATCPAGSLRYVPPGYEHSGSFSAGTHCLRLEIDRPVFDRVANLTEALQRPADIPSILCRWLAYCVYQKFLQNDPLALISIEGILLELLAETAQQTNGTGPSGNVPRWLRIAHEYLDSHFQRPLTLAEVAGVAGVHRVHLAREFRRRFSITVGEYLRKKRVEQACHLVSKTNDPLAAVAVNCGFSDQSHFTGTFRRQVGLTPGRFRQMAQAR